MIGSLFTGCCGHTTSRYGKFAAHQLGAEREPQHDRLVRCHQHGAFFAGFQLESGRRGAVETRPGTAAGGRLHAVNDANEETNISLQTQASVQESLEAARAEAAAARAAASAAQEARRAAEAVALAIEDTSSMAPPRPPLPAGLLEPARPLMATGRAPTPPKRTQIKTVVTAAELLVAEEAPVFLTLLEDATVQETTPVMFTCR